MHWTDIDHSFCEESILGLPEYYNAISSLFISLFGIYGLCKLHNELFIDILYSNFIIVGFGSVGYHWYGNIGWGLFDEIPMILSIFTGIIYADNVHFLIQKKNYDNDITYSKVLVYFRKLKVLCYFFTMSLFIIINVMSNYRKIFPLFFSFTAFYLYYKIFSLLYITNPLIKQRVIHKVYNSLFTIATSGLVWIITETSCKYMRHHIFLIGHPIWHFFIGHGFYNIIQLVYYIKLNSIRNKINYGPFYVLDIDISH
jgi:hypothetical protein